MKRPHARILVTAAAAASAVGLAVAPASAATWTVSPANTSITATQSGNTVMSSGSAKITCTGGSITGSTSNGANAVLATIGSGSESGCKDSVVGASWTITLSGGTLTGSSYSNGVTTGTISGVTAKASSSVCSFTASGSLNGTYTNSSGTLSITGGSLTLSNVSGFGCGLGGIKSGSTGSVTGNYTVSPGVTITAA